MIIIIIFIIIYIIIIIIIYANVSGPILKRKFVPPYVKRQTGHALHFPPVKMLVSGALGALRGTPYPCRARYLSLQAPHNGKQLWHKAALFYPIGCVEIDDLLYMTHNK